MRRHVRTTVVVAVWLAALVAAVALVYVRARAVAAEPQWDLERYFLPAAVAIAQGESPFEHLAYPPLAPLLLLPALDAPWVGQYWTFVQLAAAVVSCVLAALAFCRRRDHLRAGVVVLIALFTLLWSRLATVELWFGQIDFLTLLALTAAVFFDSRDRRLAAGIAVGLAAAVKTWPVLFVVWLMRAGARARVREWIGVAIAGTAVLVSIIVTGGWRGPVDFVLQALNATGQGDLPPYSVWGLAAVWFSDSTLAAPIVASPVLRILTTVIGMGVIVLLLIVTLRRPGSSGLAMFNLAFLIVLALPVSHLNYMILALPALWWWSARLLVTPKSITAWVPSIVLSAWWFLVFRQMPSGEGLTAATWSSIPFIVLITLVAATVSIVAATRLEEAGPTAATTTGDSSATRPATI